MKKEEFKKEFDNIEISEMEKLKIYNNIMNNRKKKKSWILPMISVGIVATASLVAFMIMKPAGDASPKGPIGTMALENEYKKEVIVNVKNYLNAKEINVEELEDGEEKKIDSKEIISNEKYKACKGNVIIKKYNGDLTYSTDITCGDYDRTDAMEFRIFDGLVRNVFEIGEELAIASRINVSEDGDNADANIMLFDESSDIKWTYTIESMEDVTSKIDVVGINKIGNKYYVLYKEVEYLGKTETGSYAYDESSKLIILDESGKLVEQYDFEKYKIDEFIGSTNDTAYYTASSYDRNIDDYTYVILKITEDNYDLINYEAGYDELPGISTTLDIQAFSNGYFYGFNREKGYEDDTDEYYRAKTVFKMNEKGETVWKKDVNLNIPNEDDYDIIKMIINNGQIYISYKSETDERLIAYDLDFNFINSKMLSDIKPESSYFTNLRFEDNNIVFEFQKYDTTTTYSFITTDKDLKVIDNKEVTEENIDANFAWSSLIYKRLKNNKINMVYAVDKDLNKENSILMVFYK